MDGAHDQGLFWGVRLIVGAVIFSACGGILVESNGLAQGGFYAGEDRQHARGFGGSLPDEPCCERHADRLRRREAVISNSPSTLHRVLLMIDLMILSRASSTLALLSFTRFGRRAFQSDIEQHHVFVNPFSQLP
jgi:hypothetical protein